MKKFVVLFSLSVLVFVFISCATGTAVVTGNKRAATDPASVVLYTEPPAKYETIGIVSAYSDATGIAQRDLNYAVEELKKQAAKLGANGIIIDNVSATSGSGGVVLGDVWVSDTTQNISGKAICVEK